MGTSERPTTPNINDSLLTRESWKIFQVIAEFVEGYERLVHIRPSVSIFGSARVPEGHKYYDLAYDIAKVLSNSGLSVVTGGGPGVMEAANKGAYEGSAFSVGLNIVLPNEEQNNSFQDISIRFRHFFTRKVMFLKYASALIALPGGFGTLDEIGETLALIQTHKTKEDIPIIFVCKDFWEDLLAWIENKLLKEGMIDKKDLNLFQTVETAEETLEAILSFYKKRNIDLFSYNANQPPSF